MPETVTLDTLLKAGLAGGGDRLDIEVLLGEVLGLNRAGLIRDRHQPLSCDARIRCEVLLARLLSGVPLAQILGRREFWSLDFVVDEHVLIPRPDTELLVETGLALLPRTPPGPVLDLGTGSGVVAVCVAREVPSRTVLAVDRSLRALRVAALNVSRLAPGRVQLVAGHWLAPFADHSCALLLGNPPYVEDDDPGLATEGALRFEPRSALAAGRDGLDDLKTLVADAPRCLRAGGWLALEHGATQGQAVRELYVRAGLVEVETLRDLAGLERVTRGCLASA